MSKPKPAQVFPPGDFLSEELEARGWSQSDFADIIDRPYTLISRIVNAKTAITPETAQSFSEALGTTAEFWLNLEAVYQLSKVAPPHNAIARRAQLYAQAPVKELIKRRWIESSGNLDVLEQRVTAFMAAAAELPHAARKSVSSESAAMLQRAWLARAVQLAPGVAINRTYSPGQLSELILRLRTLMLNTEDVRGVPRVLADYGIRLLVIEPLAGSRIDGATFWLDSKSPVIVLSLRYDRIDYFWYTLLHELAHVKNKDGLQLDYDLRAASDDQRSDIEVRADALATATVVPQGELEDFIGRTKPIYSAARIQGFAKRIKIHPGIVVGQLHHRGEIGYRILRQLLVPVRHIVIRAALTDGWSVDLPALEQSS